MKNSTVNPLMLLVPLSIAVGWSASSVLAPLGPLTTWIFAYLTWVSSLSTSWRDLGRAVARPWPVLVALGILHGVTPLVARLIGLVAFPDSPAIASGLILSTAIPIGVSTLMWVGLVGGDVPFALTTVALDTLLSPLIVPATIHLLIGTRVALDPVPLFAGVLKMLVLPTILAVTMHDLTRGRLASRLGAFGPLSTKLSIILAVSLSMASAVNRLPNLRLPYGRILMALVTLAVLNYLISYGVARLLRWSRPATMGLVFTAGIRNSVAGGVIAANYFSPVVTITICLMMFFQQPLAALAHHFATRRDAGETSLPA